MIKKFSNEERYGLTFQIREVERILKALDPMNP